MTIGQMTNLCNSPALVAMEFDGVLLLMACEGCRWVLWVKRTRRLATSVVYAADSLLARCDEASLDQTALDLGVVPRPARLLMAYKAAAL